MKKHKICKLFKNQADDCKLELLVSPIANSKCINMALGLLKSPRVAQANP